MVLIGSVRGRDYRPCCLDWSWSIGCRHCVSNSGSLLDTVGGRRGMGVGWRRLSTGGGGVKVKSDSFKQESKDASINNW